MVLDSPRVDWPSFVLYTKEGCGLCEGLEAKLKEIPGLWEHVEYREITTRPDWWEQYSLEVPVLCCVQEGKELGIPRTSPRASVVQVQRQIEQFLSGLSVAGFSGHKS